MLKSLLSFVLIGLLALTFGCSKTDRPTSAPTAPKAAPVPATERASLEQQRLCSDQAWREFQRYGYDKKPLADYASHFDPSTTTCYMLLHNVSSESGFPSVTKLVFDAFEGRNYANYIWINSKNQKYWEVAPMECEVKPNGREPISCSSEEEFNHLVEQHFHLAK